MQSAVKHLAGDGKPIVATVLGSAAREMLRGALHDRHLSLFRNKPVDENRAEKAETMACRLRALDAADLGYGYT